MKGGSEDPFSTLSTGSITAKNGGSIMAIIDRHEVTAREVYEYSPWLANIKAVNWIEGTKEVVRKLQREIEGESA